MNFATEPLSFTAARDWLANKTSLPTDLSSREISNQMPGSIRMQAFLSARVASASVLERLRREVEGIAAGKVGYGEARKRLTEFLASQGAPIPEAGTQADRNVRDLASTARLELILRQNVAMAHAIGQREVSEHPAVRELYPNYKYMAVQDGNARDSHAALDGLVLPKDDPFWDTHFPPWEFNCRCLAVDTDEPVNGKAAGFSRTTDDGQRTSDDGQRTTDDGHPDDASQTGMVTNGGRTVNLTPNASGFVFRSDPRAAFGEPDFERVKNPEIRAILKADWEKKAAALRPKASDLTGLHVAVNGMRVGGTGEPLTDEEKQAIHDWSSPMFADMVRAETGAMTKRVDPATAAKANAALERALVKLPGFVGTTYRGVDMKNPERRDSYLSSVRPGDRIEWDRRASSSKAESIGEGYASKSGPDQGVVYVINGKTGRDIHHWTRKNEQEVLMPANSVFRVDKIAGNRIFVSEE